MPNFLENPPQTMEGFGEFADRVEHELKIRRQKTNWLPRLPLGYPRELRACAPTVVSQAVLGEERPIELLGIDPLKRP